MAGGLLVVGGGWLRILCCWWCVIWPCCRVSFVTSALMLRLLSGLTLHLGFVLPRCSDLSIKAAGTLCEVVAIRVYVVLTLLGVFSYPVTQVS